MNCLSVYHDVIVTKKLELDGVDLLKLKQSTAFNRYTRTLLTSNTISGKQSGDYLKTSANEGNLKTIAYLLTAVQFSEVFIEMLVQKYYGQEKKWKVILYIELLKFGLKLHLFRRSGWRMLLAQCVPERDASHALANTSGSLISNQSNESLSSSLSESASVLRVGMPSMDNLKPGDVAKYLESKALSSSLDRKNPLNLMTPLSGESLIGELMFIARPLLFALLVRWKGQTSWKPWFISLAVDLLSRCSSRHMISKLIFAPSFIATLPRPTFLEKDERTRRNWLLVYYLLRRPMYDSYTKEALGDLCSVIGRVPVLSLFTGIIQQYIPLWERIHFYTSQ